MEQTVRTKQKNAISSLEAKITSYEDQLEAESKYCPYFILFNFMFYMQYQYVYFVLYILLSCERCLCY